MLRNNGISRALAKKIYHAIPLKRELYTLLKRVYQPSPDVYRHMVFNGVFPVQVDAETSFKMKHYGYVVENDMFWSGLLGGWEKESLSLWVQLCKQSQIILDIGANTGIYALVAKAINKEAKVYAFEPISRVYDKLVSNCRLNDFQICCEQKAVSNQDKNVEIFDVNQEHVYAASLNKAAAHLSSDIRSIVEAVTLDAFIKTEKLPRIDLIKIDVETHEPEVLEGFAEHIGVYKPTVLIEILSNEIADRVEMLIQEAGYLYFNIDEAAGPAKVDRLRRDTDSFVMGNYNFLLCTPEIAQSLNLL